MTCSGDATACLAGKVTVSGFTATPTRLQAKLFREFPLAGATELATGMVGYDGSYAFSGLPAWDHYFVQVAADFGQVVAPGAVVGPLAIPSSGGSADVTIKPVQLTIVQGATAGGAMQLQSALAYVYDPVTAVPGTGATVSIEVGGAPVAMKEGTQSGAAAYSASFPASTPAQSTYTVTTVFPSGTSSTWQATAGAASFTPVVSSPAPGATVPQGQPLLVEWPAQTAADEEVVVLYQQQQGSWVQAYESPQPNDADATSETVPGSVVAAGPLLLDVLFAAAHCAGAEDGCVVSDETVALQLTGN